MEKCGKSYDIYILMSVQKSAQALQRMSSCFRLAHIKCDLWFYVLPFIYYRIIHMYRVPHNICQEADCIFMKQFCSRNHYVSCRFFIRPLIRRYRFACVTVHYFPPSANIISRIDCKHIRIEVIHQVDFQRICNCCMKRCHNIHLLYFFRMRFRPGIILAGGIVSCVDFCSRIF